MSIVLYIILGFYMVALAYVTSFCLMQFHLLYIYKRKNKAIVAEDNREVDWVGQLPMVTVQLPIFNEKYVVERLINNITAMDYPKDRFEIQVLDDSTDDTLEISRKKVNEYKKLGYQIELVHREDRTGYKAGALKEGMKTAKGDYIAIFDADFLPKKEFLQKTIPHFNDPKVGVVQTRWEHLNQDYSLITQLQAFQLNVHFTVEQSGREAGKYMLQFNGTGGIWRKDAINDAGGWEADTLTEDLDLSYRAQLKGWTIKYLENLGSPAELPAEMNGLKSQQHRWMKGGAETAKKILPSVWRSNLSFMKKIHASLHLLASGIFVFVFVIGVFSVPVLFMLEPMGINVSYFAFCLIGLLSIMIVYYVANVQVAWEKQKPIKMIWKFVVLFPMFLALSMGLSLHNSIAVFQGWLGKKSPFIRTPKFNIKELKGSFKNRSYLSEKIPLTTIAEGVLCLYFVVAIVLSLITSDTSFIFFHLLLALGFGSICYYSIRHLNY